MFSKVYEDAEGEQERILGCYPSSVLRRTPDAGDFNSSMSARIAATSRDSQCLELDSRIGPGRDIGLWSNMNPIQ